jgi:hypothetical protein
VVVLSTLWLRVKILDLRGLGGGGAERRYPLGGVVVESQYHSVSFQCFRWQVLVFRVFFCLFLICCVRGSPHHLVSVCPLWLYL